MSDDNNNEKKFYKPFNPLPEDGKENEWRYKTVPTSKMHVRRVCDVMAKRRGIPDKQRMKYADQAGYKDVSEDNAQIIQALARLEEQVESDEDTDIDVSTLKKRMRMLPKFEIYDVYSEYHVHAALAEAVFDGFPKLLDVKETEDGWEVEIVNQELFDRLDEGVVNAAFLSFSNDRNGIQRSLKNAYPKSGSGRIPQSPRVS